MRPLNPFAPEWTPTALSAQSGNEAKPAIVEILPQSKFDLAGLPSEVITSVVSFLSDPRDLASCICACKSLRGHVHEAEVVLDIRTWRNAQGPGNGNNFEELWGSTTKALLGLSKYVPGTVALLLPNLPLDDSDLEYIFARLPRLQMLDMSGSRKITQSGVTALSGAASGTSSTFVQYQHIVPAAGKYGSPDLNRADLGFTTQASQSQKAVAPMPTMLGSPSMTPRLSPPRMPLSFVNLQRCYQLHGGSLDALLAIPGLRGLALSHLDLGRWPHSTGGLGSLVSDAMKPPTAARLMNRGLQVLALNNCMRLHGAAIDTLAATCGGSRVARSVMEDGNVGSSSLRVLLLGGSTLATSTFISSSNSPPELPARFISLLHAAYRPAVTSTAVTIQAQLAAAQHLLAAVLSLPRLEALELSFFAPPLVQCLRKVLADSEVLGPTREPVEVWDFAAADGVGDVAAARRTLRRALRVAYRLSDDPRDDISGGMVAIGDQLPALVVSRRGGELLDSLAVSTVLRCAVHCSSVTRSTPLHLAAERGNAERVVQLLAAGAVVHARDVAGSTALFLASEAGHTGVVARMLAAGADPTLGNAAGETPMYIAALRGHLGCVKELLMYCQARGIAWQDPELYGDAWTPLHAAAVANRADVAAYLLQAAGSSGAGELVLAPNKYGQSVLHVAARKGSSQLLRMLLSAGGSELVGSRDGSGNTPVDVAKKNRHVEALAEFRRLIAAGSGHDAGRRQQVAATAMA